MMNEKEKISKLNQLIDEMCVKKFSQDTNKIDQWILTLNRIYANDFRHTYSDIFLKIQTIIADGNSEVLEILGENINILKKAISLKLSENNDDANLKITSRSFDKFADHIFLEIGRYNFLKNHFESNRSENTSSSFVVDNTAEFEALKKDVTEMSKAIDNIRPITTQAQKSLDSLDSKLESNKISSITTLTIFSAVVLAFSGGITFEAGIFKGLENSSVYRLVFTIALTGFILFNTIFALLYLVGKLSGKNIGTKCKYYANSGTDKPRCGDGYCGKSCHSVSVPCRLFHKYSYVVFVNIVLIWTIYIDTLLWIFKNDLTLPIHIVLQCVPVVCIAIGCIIYWFYNVIKYNRIKTKFKVGIVRKIVTPEESNNGFSVLLSALASAFRSKPISERYFDEIQGCSYKEALKILDKYAEEAITLNKDYFDFVSHKEYRLLKKQWKE